MQVFTHEFQTFIKSLILCSWRGHNPGKWKTWYWALAHFGGYRKFCQRCGMQVSTDKEEHEYFQKQSKTSEKGGLEEL